PSVRSLNHLVEVMSSLAGTPSITIKKLNGDDLSEISKFYLSVGYNKPLQAENSFYGAFDDFEMIGLVRLAIEEGVHVLRGMQIKPEYQFFGTGTRLIESLAADLSGDCYCIPHGWLAKFYGQIGFQTVGPKTSVPNFLAMRLEEEKK